MTDKQSRAAAPAPDDEFLRSELDRAWREVDFIAKERDDFIRERDSAKVDLEQVCDERDKYQAVYAAANALMARLGYDGAITTDNPLVETLMNALDQIDNGPKG